MPEHVAPPPADGSVLASRDLPGWLATMACSLAFSTYQTGKLFLLGVRPDGVLSVFERTFERAMGMWVEERRLWLGSAFQIWRLENVLDPGVTHDGYDALYVPRAGYVTGDIDVHDVARDADGRVLMVNTKYNCIAELSERHGFRVVWAPPFISDIAPGDRCHLNGMALVDGHVAYATAASRSNVLDGWRDHRDGGGVVMDVRSGEVIAEGLSMPHSPRWHNGCLWLLNAGTGHLGFLEPDSGHFTEVAFCPGFARGLAFVGEYAVIALSRPRRNGVFEGLDLQRNLDAHSAIAQCGLHVINTTTGHAEQWVRIEGFAEELYDVAVIPHVVRPMALGFQSDEIRRLTSIEACGQGENPAP